MLLIYFGIYDAQGVYIVPHQGLIRALVLNVPYTRIGFERYNKRINLQTSTKPRITIAPNPELDNHSILFLF